MVMLIIIIIVCLRYDVCSCRGVCGASFDVLEEMHIATYQGVCVTNDKGFWIG
jgi:hypothetical protein